MELDDELVAALTALRAASPQHPYFLRDTTGRPGRAEQWAIDMAQHTAGDYRQFTEDAQRELAVIAALPAISETDALREEVVRLQSALDAATAVPSIEDKAG